MQKKHSLPWFNPSSSDLCFCKSGLVFGDCCGQLAEDRKPPAGVLLYPGFVNPETCIKWVNKFQTKTGSEAKVSGISETSPLRVCTNVNPGVLRKVINDKVREAFQLAASQTGRSIAWFERPNVLRYTKGGFYKQHADSCIMDADSRTCVKIHDRDISLLIYMNEDFTGGGIEFTNFNYRLRPKSGDMLAFPSDNRYEHQAELVQSGIRFVIVSWAAFEGSKRVLGGPPPGAIMV
jgi:predicted 2-oxoglutarate/Fe(II)-dependent dioxygenase YbiX